MLLIDNFLEEHHLNHLLKDLDNCRANSALWRYNQGFWPKNLIKDFSGEVKIAPASYSVSQMLRTLINQYSNLRNFRFFNAQYTLWSKGSGLAPHYDPQWGLAATLYLNDTWNKEWGGILTWADNCHVPCFNSMVINNSNKQHWVSEVTADQTRITVQCWAK